MLSSCGAVSTDDINKADIVILNTCAIRENAHNKAFGMLGRLKHLKNTKKDFKKDDKKKPPEEKAKEKENKEVKENEPPEIEYVLEPVKIDGYCFRSVQEDEENEEGGGDKGAKDKKAKKK